MLPCVKGVQAAQNLVSYLERRCACRWYLTGKVPKLVDIRRAGLRGELDLGRTWILRLDDVDRRS